MKKHRIYTMSFASVYPHYLAKAEKKGRSKKEVDEMIRWLTGYTQRELDAQIRRKADVETFFAQASRMNPLRRQITGVICGIRIEEIEEPLMREIRILDKLIDELAKGKAVGSILGHSEAGGLPKIGAPATRALHGIGVTTLEELVKYSLDDLLQLHGFGPSAMKILQREMATRGMALRSESTGAAHPKKPSTKGAKKTETPVRRR